VNAALEASFDRRLRELEYAIEELRSSANPASSSVYRGAALSRAGGTPAAPTGVELLSATPGAITVGWNAPLQRDIVRFDVQISTSSVFIGDARTFAVSSSSESFTYTTEDPEATYYIRVRTVGSQRASEWSAVVNSTTGAVTTAHFEAGAATEIYEYTKSSSFTNLNTNNETETYGPVTVDVYDDTSVVEPAIIFEFDYSSNYSGANNCRVKFDFLRRPSGGSDTTVDTVTVDFKSVVPSSGGGTARAVAPVFTAFDAPGAGLFEYRIKVTTEIGAGNTLSFQGVDLIMEFVQSKRTA
jgi:hypothetical protein